MSAFAIIYERSNHTPGASGVFNKIMECLNHRGPDGSDVISARNIVMGHWHFWTTPEEVGERQPLELNGLPFKIVLDGRIDNREELFSKLNIAPAEGKLLSDAALILRAYVRWGENSFQYFIGEYALVIFDEQKNEIVCVRDPLGDRSLFYTLRDSQMIIASEPWAVASASHQPELDENAAAHYFALRSTENGQTLFKDVYELLPAHLMIVNPSSQRALRYWQPNAEKKIRYKTDAEYAEHFRALLEESVRCQLRAATPVGVLMSGGLDSPSVASLAAQMLAPAQLTTISHVFYDEELKECDERSYIETMKEKWNIRSIQIPGDDAWPLKDWQKLPINKNHPEINAYRWLKERAYIKTKQEGLRVLLTGGFGDHLYGAGNEWLADLIAEGKLHEAAREVIFILRYAGWRRNWRAGYLQQTVKRALNTLLGEKIPRPKPKMPIWLTAFSTERLPKKQKALPQSLERHSVLLGLWASKMCVNEAYYANRHAVELRNPYRDRRLIEFVLALPAYQLHYRGLYKHILRVAMQGILPESIRTRRKPTSLTPFFFRGMEREKNYVQSCLQDSQAKWRKYINADWVLKNWKDKNKSVVLMPWLFASYESWHQSTILSSN